MALKKKRQQSYKDYGLLSLTLITVAFFLFFAIRPSLGIILSLNKERTDYTEVNAQLEFKIQQIIQMQTNYITLLSKKQFVDKAVPSAHEIKNIASIFQSQNVTIESVDVQKITIKPTTEKGLITIPIALTANAPYTDFVTFTRRITNLARLYRFRELEVTREKEGSQSATIKFNALIETYYFLE